MAVVADHADGHARKRSRQTADVPGGFTYVVDKDGEPGRRKIRIEFIQDKSRRHITFSKRKAGIMKKVRFQAFLRIEMTLHRHMSCQYSLEPKSSCLLCPRLDLFIPLPLPSLDRWSIRKRVRTSSR
jgi:hypothetical protein